MSKKSNYTANDMRSNNKNPNHSSRKSSVDNRSNQLNPNNKRYNKKSK